MQVDRHAPIPPAAMGEAFFMGRRSISLPGVRGPVLENPLVCPQEVCSSKLKEQER